jgi:PAS domain S-box-containing protein
MVDDITMPLRDLDGRLAGFGKILRNVSALKEAEDSSRALAGALEQSNVVIQCWDGRIEHWTEGCGRLYGWAEPEALGQIASDLLKTVFPIPLSEIQRQLMAEGTWQGELRQVRKDGSAVFVSAQWVLLTSGGDDTPLVIATHTDITARLKMQHELEAANERLKRMANELERSNAELEEFARIASHDLSAPITTARWLVDLLSSRHGRQLDADGSKCVEQISLSLERMSDLVEAVLAHAQVGKSAIGSSEDAEAEEALAMALENLRRDIATSEAVVAHDPLPPLPIQPQPLSQLFQNLLSNAIKYRRPGTAPQVQITAERQGPSWLLGVRDNGIGIEPEWHERIFLPLQRRRGMPVAGSGIGLATCKKIVTRAGGRIWVESEAGSGSTFYFTLPASRPVGEL